MHLVIFLIFIVKKYISQFDVKFVLERGSLRGKRKKNVFKHLLKIKKK